MNGRTSAWKRLRDLLARLGRWSHKGRDGRRTAADRARFWADAREGEREAAERARD
jgi:hypothetical protein